MMNAGSDDTTTNPVAQSQQLVKGGYISNSQEQIAAFYFDESGVWSRVRSEQVSTLRPGIRCFSPLYDQNSADNNQAHRVQGSYAPPRLGDSQIPVLPITLPGETDGDLASSRFIGSTENSYLNLRDAGQLRDVFCAPWNAVGEGDVLNINGVDHLCIRGKWMDSDTGIYGFRMVYKLA
jgi:hypothetical protein